MGIQQILSICMTIYQENMYRAETNWLELESIHRGVRVYGTHHREQHLH